jgi:zinc protease
VRRSPVRVELPNGTVVIVVRDPGAPVVAIRALWAGGSRIEDDARAGATALLAATVTRGCGERDAAAMARELADLGGSLEGTAGRDGFGLAAEWRPETWARGFDRMAECIVAPRLDAAVVERARERQLAAMTAARSDPARIAARLFHQAMYRRHPYRRDPLGTPASLAGLTRDELAAFYRESYPVSRLVVVVVGDVEPDAVIARARSRLGARPRVARALPPRPPADRFDGRPIAEREVYAFVRDRDLAHLVIGFPGGVVDHADRHARDVLVELVGGQGGRLFRSVRDRLGLAYHVAVHSALGVDPGYLAIEISCAPDRVDRVLAAVRAELDAVATGQVTADDVARARRAVIGERVRDGERRAAIAHGLAYHEAHGLGIDEHARIPARIAAVTAADVQAIAARALRWDRAVIATVAPPALSPAARRRARTR